MEEKAREIEQLQMQLKAKIKESELTIQDLEVENLDLKQKLFQEEEENKSAPEKVQCCFLWLYSTSGTLYLVVIGGEPEWPRVPMCVYACLHEPTTYCKSLSALILCIICVMH